MHAWSMNVSELRQPQLETHVEQMQTFNKLRPSSLEKHKSDVAAKSGNKANLQKVCD